MNIGPDGMMKELSMAESNPEPDLRAGAPAAARVAGDLTRETWRRWWYAHVMYVVSVASWGPG